MEWKIGEIRQIKGEWYQCINPKKYGCSYCDLQNKCIDDIKGKVAACHARYRSDKKCVVFKKLEKVGEPFERNGYMYQEYKTHTYPLLMNGDTKIPTPNGFAVIIKQNQEYMEEKKQKLDKLVEDYSYNRIPYEVFDNCLKQLYVGKQIGENNSSLKEFDLEQAKAGKSVCTRDGRKARIICFDRVTNSTNEYTGPLIVLVTNLNGDEKPFCYTENGNLAGDEYDNHKWDLMMFSEKKSGWANIVKGSDGCPHMGRGIFQSKEAAEDAIKAFSSKLIDTIKIEWYE